MQLKADFQLEVMGLSCPMPIIKTKKAMAELVDGQILEVAATDKGSKADLAAWAETVGHHYIGTIEDGIVLKHYIRKCADNDRSSTVLSCIHYGRGQPDCVFTWCENREENEYKSIARYFSGFNFSNDY